MSKAAPTQSEAFLGTPAPLPRFLFCHVPKGPAGAWCGRGWTANTWKEFEEVTKARLTHQTLCGSLEDVRR